MLPRKFYRRVIDCEASNWGWEITLSCGHQTIACFRGRDKDGKLKMSKTAYCFVCHKHLDYEGWLEGWLRETEK